MPPTIQSAAITVHPPLAEPFVRAVHAGDDALATHLVHAAHPPVNHLFSITTRSPSGRPKVCTRSPLQLAVISGNAALARVLLAAGADVNLLVREPAADGDDGDDGDGDDGDRDKDGDRDDVAEHGAAADTPTVAEAIAGVMRQDGRLVGLPSEGSAARARESGLAGATHSLGLLSLLDEPPASARVSEISAVGTAVVWQKAAMLDVLHGAGADLGLARRETGGGEGPLHYSALQLALQADFMDAGCACVLWLFNVARIDACMPVDLASKAAVLSLAMEGSSAIPLFKILVQRGLDVKALDVLKDKRGVGTTGALISIAAKLAGKQLLAYFVKDLGLIGTLDEVSKMGVAVDALAKDAVAAAPEVRMSAGANVREGEGSLYSLKSFDDLLPRLVCAYCAKISKMSQCSGCHSANYCCARHQKKHWRHHKIDCRILTRIRKEAERRQPRIGNDRPS